MEHLIEVDGGPWATAPKSSNRNWRTSIARFSSRVQLRYIPTAPLNAPEASALPVSLPGTLALAEVTVESTGEVITVVSMYGAWEQPIGDAKTKWIYADGAVHRLLSDLSALIARQHGHKIIAAGDLNILCGYGDLGSPYWRDRYSSVFQRLEAIGLKFVGPQATDGGQQASPWPSELPVSSQNVPTYRTRQGDPNSATRQLDFVFASKDIAARVRTRALNTPAEWGPSDHCRVLIELLDKPER
jgi:exonuclease III